MSYSLENSSLKKKIVLSCQKNIKNIVSIVILNCFETETKMHIYYTANRAPTAPIGIPRQMGRGPIPPSNSPYNSPAQHQPGPYNRNSYNSPIHHHQSPSGPYQSPSGRFPTPHGLNSGSPAGFSTPQANR